MIGCAAITEAAVERSFFLQVLEKKQLHAFLLLLCFRVAGKKVERELTREMAQGVHGRKLQGHHQRNSKADGDVMQEIFKHMFPGWLTVSESHKCSLTMDGVGQHVNPVRLWVGWPSISVFLVFCCCLSGSTQMHSFPHPPNLTLLLQPCDHTIFKASAPSFVHCVSPFLFTDWVEGKIEQDAPGPRTFLDRFYLFICTYFIP